VGRSASPKRQCELFGCFLRRGAVGFDFLPLPILRVFGQQEVLIHAVEQPLHRLGADIIDISKLSGDTIKFGATVTLVDEDTDKKAVWQIVGEPEADAKKGRISITSPLARALIGKKKGASVEVVAPGGPKAYEITKVEWR
jgi:transcription elongation GreA/GreB family factor